MLLSAVRFFWAEKIRFYCFFCKNSETGSKILNWLRNGWNKNMLNTMGKDWTYFRGSEFGVDLKFCFRLLSFAKKASKTGFSQPRKIGLCWEAYSCKEFGGRHLLVYIRDDGSQKWRDKNIWISKNRYTRTPSSLYISRDAGHRALSNYMLLSAVRFFWAEKIRFYLLFFQNF